MPRGTLYSYDKKVDFDTAPSYTMLVGLPACLATGSELDIRPFAIEGLVLENCNSSIYSKYVNGVFNHLAKSSMFESLKEFFSSCDHISMINMKKCNVIFETLYANLKVVTRVFHYNGKEGVLYPSYDNFTNDPKDCLILELVKFDNYYSLFTKNFPSLSLPLLTTKLLDEGTMAKNMRGLSQRCDLNHLLFYTNVKSKEFKEEEIFSIKQLSFYIKLFDDSNLLERLGSSKPEEIPQESEHYVPIFQRSTSEFFFQLLKTAPKGTRARISLRHQVTSSLPTEHCVKGFDPKTPADEDEREVDSCFCPNLLLPTAASSRSAPHKTYLLRSSLEKVGLADKPVLARLYEAANLSISFFDIETLLRASTSKGLKVNKLLNKEEMEKDRFQTYCQGMQEPVCIGSLSATPSINICSEIWETLTFDSQIGSLDDLSLQQNLWIKLKRLPVELKNKYLHQIKTLMTKQLSSSEELLSGCKVFHIEGNRPSYNGEICSTYNEPSPLLIKGMVFKWLDDLFQQAAVSKVLKALLLEPLWEQLELIAKTCGGRKGIFARIEDKLRTLINTQYVFG